MIAGILDTVYFYTMLKLTFICLLAVVYVESSRNRWWKNAVIYQVYPRSFKDSNGDGIGDLPGITSKLEHIKDIGADALWLSPFYTSPQVDFGYDISNFTDVEPKYGTIKHFNQLITKAKSLGLKVILDFVPNHSSDQHPWFKKSVQRVKPFDDFYVWRDAKMVNGVRKPPNNWLSTFSDSAWQWNEQRGQYYLHQFAIEQPDLNYRNKAVLRAMSHVLKFWLDRGVDGFRVDAVNFLFEDKRMLNEPRISNDLPDNDYDSLDHIYSKDQPETYKVIKFWRHLLDRYALKHQTNAKLMITEAYVNQTHVKKYYEAGSNPFNFLFITALNATSSALEFKRTLDKWMNDLPRQRISNWVTGNHDQARLVTRYGSKKADMVMALAIILPGFTVVYNGDEIGMVNKNLTWEETLDVAGCNAGPDRFFLKSRDPERTPFQWDDTTSAGFSANNKTWLPVHENYVTLNLAAQESVSFSNYKYFKSLTLLKRNLPILEKGSIEIILISEDVLAVVRRLRGTTPLVLVMNMAGSEVVVDASGWLNLPDRQMKVYTTNVESQTYIGTTVNTDSLRLPGLTSFVLMSKSQWFDIQH